MQNQFCTIKKMGRVLLVFLLPLMVMPLAAQYRSTSPEKLFIAYTGSGRGLSFWLQSRTDFDLVSAAASALDTVQSPLPLLAFARTAPNAVFLSAQAVQSVDEADRTELSVLAEQGVPIVCECGEYALSRLIGFMPVEQDSSSSLEFFVYSKTAEGVRRSSVLFAGAPQPAESGAPETLPGRDQLRAFLLREALRQSLEGTPSASGKADRVLAASPVPSAGEGSWTNLANMRKVWTWTGPEVCAATTQCWDYSKEANTFTVTADFYKIPDAVASTDYYLVRVNSQHQANSKVPYLNNWGGCSDGWEGWFVTARELKLERTDTTSVLYEYGPTGTLKQQTISYTLGASLDTKAAGINASYSISYTNSDATVYDNSSIPGNYADWGETFIGPNTNGSVPSPIARGTFFSERAAIYSTSNPAAGVNLKISPAAQFDKTRYDYGFLCSGPSRIFHRYLLGDPKTVNIRWNYPPNTPPKPNLTMPSGASAYWTNTPLTVNVPKTTDRDGDTITYSVDFGDGSVGAYGAETQTHSWKNPGAIYLKAKAQDTYKAASDWSDSATYTIKGLDRIQIEALPQIPEMSTVQLQCRASLSDGSTQLVTSDYPSGWEGGAIRWSITSPYATVSNTGVLQALSAQGADRVITVNVSYTLKGIEKTTSSSVVIKSSGLPLPAISSVVNGASFLPNVSGSAWITISGTNLASTTRSWRGEEIIGGMLPTVLDGVSVTINGKSAALCYISPTQLNVQVPSGLAPGAVSVRVTTTQGAATATAQMNDFSPGLFTIGGKYVAAQHLDYSYVAKAGLLSGVAASPARPGEVVILYATGFGPTVPELPSGTLITTAAPLVNPVTVSIGNRAADVQWKGMSGAGLWQLNVAIPADAPDGDNAVLAEVGGVRTQAGISITVQR